MDEQKDSNKVEIYIYYFFLGFIAVIIGFLICKIVIPEYFNQINIKRVKSSIDNKKWNIQDDLKCPTCAADLMAEIHQDIDKLFRHLKKNYSNDPRTNRLIKRYDTSNVYEGRPSPGGSGDTSYTINKGEKVVYCLRSARSKNLHEKNVIMYTVIHELGHIAGIKYDGHGAEFQTNFRWLLDRSIEIGIYNPVNYSTNPKEFCGIMINSSILY